MPIREEEFEARVSPLAPWKEILRAAVRARYTPGGLSYGRAAPRIARGAGGCLKRLLLLMLFLFVAFVGALFFFGQALLGAF